MKKLLFLLLLIPTWGFAQTYDDATLLVHDSTQIKQLGTSQVRSWQMFKEVIQNKVSSNAFKISAGGDITWGTGFAGAARTLTADGSATDVSVNINPKGAGGVSLINSLFQFGSVAGSATLLVNGTGAFTIFGPDGATSNGKDIYLKAGDGGTLSGTFNGGSTYLSGGLGSGGGVTGNVGFGTSVGSFGGGSKVVFVANAAVNPSTNPTGGFILYGDAGNASHPTVRLPSGTTVDLSVSFTNTAANNEIPKSNGGAGIVPSGLFNTTLGNIDLGTGLSGATRTISATGSAADIDISLLAKGSFGKISFTHGSGFGPTYFSLNSLNLGASQVYINGDNGGNNSLLSTSFPLDINSTGKLSISTKDQAGAPSKDISILTGAATTSTNNSGNILLDIGTSAGGVRGSIGLFGGLTPTFGGGSRVLFFGDATTNPTTNPTSGGIMFVKSSDHSPYWRTPAGVETSMLGGSAGTVSTVSVVSANGLAGTVANPTTTPAITLSTTITGLLKGNGTAISAASAGTDYQAPITFGTGVQTALGVNVGSAGAPILFNGAGGTPTSLTLTNATGLPLTTGATGILPVANGGTNASSASITSFNNITGYTASGATGTTSTNLVFSASPAFTGTPTLGTLGYSDTGILFSLQSSTNSYNQFIIQNTNSGATASSSYQVNNDVTTATTHYGEFGINSSGFTGSGSFNLANAVFLDAGSDDLTIGTLGNKTLHFFTNNATTDALTISGAGVFTFNTPVKGSTWGGSWTATAAADYNVAFGGTFTAASGTGVTGYLFNPTLNAVGTSSVQIGLDVNPTFAGGTTPVNIGLRVKTGGVIIGNFSTVQAGEILLIRNDQNAANTINIFNNTSGTAAKNEILFGTSTSTSALRISSLSAAFTTSGMFVSGADVISGGLVPGLHVGTLVAGPLVLYTSNTERARFLSTGEFLVGGGVTPVSTLDVSGSFGVNITSTSADITLDATYHTVLVSASGANRTITLPASSGCTRRIYRIKKTDATANTVTIDGNASETIDGALTKVVNTQYSGYAIQSDGSNWSVIATF